MDNADKKLGIGVEPVLDQIWRPYALVRNKESAFGGPVFIEFIAYKPKQKMAHGWLYAYHEPFVSASPRRSGCSPAEPYPSGRYL